MSVGTLINVFTVNRMCDVTDVATQTSNCITTYKNTTLSVELKLTAPAWESRFLTLF